MCSMINWFPPHKPNIDNEIRFGTGFTFEFHRPFCGSSSTGIPFHGCLLYDASSTGILFTAVYNTTPPPPVFIFTAVYNTKSLSRTLFFLQCLTISTSHSCKVTWQNFTYFDHRYYDYHLQFYNTT